MTPVTAADFVRRAEQAIRSVQQRWAADGLEDEERWGAALGLKDASIVDGVLLVRFVAPEGRRLNYRWQLPREDRDGYDALADPDNGLSDLSWQFWNDVLIGGQSDPDADGVVWFGHGQPPRPVSTPAKFVKHAVATIRHIQQGWAADPADDDRRWAAELRMDGASIDGDALIVRFVSPAGERIGYRRSLRRDDQAGEEVFADFGEALRDLSWQFWEAVDTSGCSEPDADGVRWFGDIDQVR